MDVNKKEALNKTHFRSQIWLPEDAHNFVISSIINVSSNSKSDWHNNCWGPYKHNTLNIWNKIVILHFMQFAYSGLFFRIKKLFYSKGNTRHHFFTERVVSRWNSLPQEALCVPSVNAFKGHLTRIRNTKMSFFKDCWSAEPQGQLRHNRVDQPGK